MIVFTRLGGRGSVGVRGMIVFSRLSGRTFPESSSRRHTAATGFAGISTNAALPLSKAASVLSRGFDLPTLDGTGIESMEETHKCLFTYVVF